MDSDVSIQEADYRLLIVVCYFCIPGYIKLISDDDLDLGGSLTFKDEDEGFEIGGFKYWLIGL